MIPTDKTLSYKDLAKYKVSPKLLSAKLKSSYVLRYYFCVCGRQTNSGVVEEDVERARETLVNIQGHLVELPLHFLEKENLTPDFDYIINFAPDTLVQ